MPAFDFVSGSADESRDEGGTVVARRPGRRQKNTTIEVVKIVAGALLAIPAAQIILWWFVPGDWKRDLLGIGPAVSRVAPWIVPEKFRAFRETELSERSASGDASYPPQETRRNRAKSRSSNGSADTASELARGASPTDISGGGEEGHKDGLVESIDADQMHSSVVPPNQEMATTGLDSDSQPTDARTSAAQQPGTQQPAPGPTRDDPVATQIVKGVRGAPQFGLPDVRQAVEAALQASIAWDANPLNTEGDRTKLTEQFYTAFARLGETITYFVPTKDPAERDLVGAVSDILATFAQQPKKLAMIGNRSSQWIDQSDRPSQGILLFGTVKQIQQRGQLYETELELASRKQRSLTIVSRLDPRPFYGPDDRILMLGALVQNPVDNLIGYEGTDPMVAMGGLPSVLKP